MASDSWPSKVSKDVSDAFSKSPRVDVFLMFASMSATQAVEGQTFATRTDRLTFVNNFLKNQAEQSQAPIKELLAARTSEYESLKSFSINNSLFLEGASEKIVRELATRSEVIAIEPNKEASLFEKNSN